MQKWHQKSVGLNAIPSDLYAAGIEHFFTPRGTEVAVAARRRREAHEVGCLRRDRVRRQRFQPLAEHQLADRIDCAVADQRGDDGNKSLVGGPPPSRPASALWRCRFGGAEQARRARSAAASSRRRLAGIFGFVLQFPYHLVTIMSDYEE